MTLSREATIRAFVLWLVLVTSGCAMPSSSLAPSPADTDVPSPSAADVSPSPAQTIVASPTPSPIAWTAVAIPEYTTVGGADIARGLDSGAEFIHVVVSNREDGWPVGEGILDASVYERSTDGGLTWGDELVMGGTSPQVAADGRNVIVTYLAYDCGSGIGVQRNRDGGASGAWSRVICLTRRPRWDFGSDVAPHIATGDGTVYVAAAESRAHVAVWISRDRGRTWTKTILGDRDAEADTDWPETIDVAATGDLVAVAWSDRRGGVLARASGDSGVTWTPSEPIGSRPGALVSASGSDHRLAFSGGSGADTWIALWVEDGGWTSVSTANVAPAGPSVVLRPDADVALLDGYCRRDDATDMATGSRWWASTDNGRTWASPVDVSGCLQEPHPIWTSDGRILLIEVLDDGYGLRIGQ